jgi:predicted glycoside hydrolase/deacetylase ChbG (UPF0249 family)
MARRLVVNADDFGWSRSVNRGIVETHQRGIVTRASILATGWAFEDAVELALATPSLGIGVHLNFYRGRTVLGPERIPSILAVDGALTGSWREIVGRLVLGRLALDEVEAELRAQIERVVATGLKPDHLDSEKHLHLWPDIFDLVCGLAVEFGIPEVRTVSEPASMRAVPAALGVLSRRDARVARRLGVRTPPATIGVTRPPTDLRALERILASARRPRRVRRAPRARGRGVHAAPGDGREPPRGLARAGVRSALQPRGRRDGGGRRLRTGEVARLSGGVVAAPGPGRPDAGSARPPSRFARAPCRRVSTAAGRTSGRAVLRCRASLPTRSAPAGSSR